MDFKTVVGPYLGVLVGFLAFFIPALKAGWIFNKAGDVSWVMVFVSAGIFVLLFVGATLHISSEVKKGEVEAGRHEAIMDQLELLHVRVEPEGKVSLESAREKAKRTYQVAKNNNANLLIDTDGSEKEGGIGTWFTPMWKGHPRRKFYLMDLVGHLDRNRISVFFTEENSLVCQILTSDGRKELLAVDISSWTENEHHLIIVQWKTEDDRVELGVDGKIYVKTIPNLSFDVLGPLLFKGIDFEGKFPGDLTKGGPSLSAGLEKLGYRELKK